MLPLDQGRQLPDGVFDSARMTERRNREPEGRPTLEVTSVVEQVAINEIQKSLSGRQTPGRCPDTSIGGTERRKRFETVRLILGGFETV